MDGHAEFVTHYNTVRLHSAIAYITPADKLAGRAEAIWAARREKLAQADARRRAKAKEIAESRPAELHRSYAVDFASLMSTTVCGKLDRPGYFAASPCGSKRYGTNCVTPITVRAPGRRIGQRGDAT